jgi:hypothetical protein
LLLAANHPLFVIDFEVSAFSSRWRWLVLAALLSLLFPLPCKKTNKQDLVANTPQITISERKNKTEHNYERHLLDWRNRRCWVQNE